MGSLGTFFDWPTGRLAAGLAVALALLLAGLALATWRATVLVKLGARNVARRRLRAALIVFGLTLSTTVIGSAFGTGDTITYTLRALVTKSLGTVDEVVVLNPPHLHAADQLKLLTQGGYGLANAGDLGFFSPQAFDRLATATRDSPTIAAIAPAIADQVTVVHGESQQLRTAVALLALQTPAPAFGALTTPDGTPIVLERLAADEVVLNAAAASAFGVTTGDTLQIRAEGGPPNGWSVRVAAVARDGGIGGVQPLLFVPLARYGQVIGQAGYNEILVVNRGGLASVTRSAAAASELRALLADPRAVRQLHDYLGRPSVQRALQEAAGTLSEPDRQRLDAVRVEATRPEVTDRFTSLLTDPRVRRQLSTLAWNIPNWTERHAVITALRNVATLSVLELKQEGLDQANQYGNVVTTVFLVLGIFSIAASLLLIVLIFTLLAADREVELATLRALGMRRRQIGAIFLVEGLLYTLLGAALGALGGLAATRWTVQSLTGALRQFGITIEPHVEPRTPLIAFGFGVLLTFAAMAVAAWRVSHLQIVAATRGEAVGESRWGRGLLGAFLTLAAGYGWWRWFGPATTPLPFYAPRQPLLQPALWTLVLLGLATCLLALPRGRASRAGERLAEGVTLGAGLALVALWFRVLLRLPTPYGNPRDDAIAAAVGGLALVLASVWTATRGLGPALRVLAGGPAAPARLRAIARPAAAYLGRDRRRAGLTAIMFGLVIFIMVASLTLIDVLLNAYTSREAPVAGFALRGDLPSNAALPDIGAALAGASAISRDAFGALGGVTAENVQVVQLGVQRATWRSAPLLVADDGFFQGIQASIARRAPGYASDAAVWAAVRDRPGVAVVTTSLLANGLALPDQASGGFAAPLTVWARPPEGGQPVKLTVIGAIDAHSQLDAGLYVSRATAAGLAVPLPAPTTYFFAVRPGTKVQDAAEGLRVSFAGQGLMVTDLGNALQLGQSLRLLLTQLVRGFMGLGLIAGVAALGLLGAQAVLERRQQLGTLRALGFTRGQVRALLALESSAIAALGIALGVFLGLVLARSLVTLLAARYPELQFAIPTRQLAGTAALAWLGALGALALTAWQAGRVAPADALRATA